MIVDVSLVIMKNVFTILFELCEWRKLGFVCLEKCGNVYGYLCRTLFCLHFKIYAETIIEIFFFMINRDPYKVSFSYRKKVPPHINSLAVI